MPTSSFDKAIIIKSKKAVNKFYTILDAPVEKFIPNIDVEKELKRRIKIFKEAGRGDSLVSICEECLLKALETIGTEIK